MAKYKRKSIVDINNLAEEFYNLNKEYPDLKEVICIRNPGEPGNNYNIFTSKEIQSLEGFQFFEFADNENALEKIISNMKDNCNKESLPIQIRIIKMKEDTNNLGIHIIPYIDPFAEMNYII